MARRGRRYAMPDDRKHRSIGLEPVLTIKEVSALEQMTPHAISRKAKAGLFPGAYRAGTGPTSPWRFPQSSIAEYRRRQAVESTPGKEEK